MKLLIKLQSLILNNPDTKVKIDLEKQIFTILSTGESVKFAINPYKKECLLKRLDDIDFLLGIKNLITSFENKKPFKMRVEIMDTTLRDGEQTQGVSYSPLEKLHVAKLLLKDLRVDRIEVASARVSSGELRQ